MRRKCQRAGFGSHGKRLHSSVFALCSLAGTSPTIHTSANPAQDCVSTTLDNLTRRWRPASSWRSGSGTRCVSWWRLPSCEGPSLGCCGRTSHVREGTSSLPPCGWCACTTAQPTDHPTRHAHTKRQPASQPLRQPTPSGMARCIMMAAGALPVFSLHATRKPTHW